MTGDQDCAVEATQEAFLRAFERFGTLREPEKFPVWVASIAIHAARDILRRRRREVPSNAETFDVARQQQIGGGLEELVCSLEDARSLREAVQRLPVDSRAVIVLYYLREQDIADIARTLGVPEGTVKSRLSHARSLLRRMVEQDRKVETVSPEVRTANFGDIESQRGRAHDLER